MPKKLGDISLSNLLTVTNIAILILGLIAGSFIYYTLIIILEIFTSTPYSIIGAYSTFIIHRLIMLGIFITWIIMYGKD